MTTAIVSHKVADFDAWRVVFDEHEKVRRSHGCTGHELYHDGNAVTIVMHWPARSNAEAFSTDPSLKEAMGRAGVMGAPDIRILDDTETISY